MKITVDDHGTIKIIECEKNESLLDAMKRHQIYIPAYCAGRGTCKKCRIQLLEGTLPITEADRKAFDEEALARGMRLSCQAYPQEECKLALHSDSEAAFEVLTSSVEYKTTIHAAAKDTYGIAVDIGTTTIAMELVAHSSGHVCATDSRINHQRAWGADVISRIQASIDGAGNALKYSICTDLLDGFEALLMQSGITVEQVADVAVAANTTMCHLLMGYPCHSLGVSPFTPVNIDVIRTTVLDVMGDVAAERMAELAGTNDHWENVFKNIRLMILPGISTFVGADIVGGLLVSDFARNEDVSMLIDLGTNGEMVIGNKDRRIATSTAAGPAFEGGNISCGIGSVKGAICSVTLEDGGMHWQTIGGGAPVGICGTGVLDITAELVEHGLVDETGLLDDAYFDHGVYIADALSGEPITFTQKDVREIQLAKAAVRAGIEVLMKRYGVAASEISCVYLAGGFGFRLDITKAIAIGLLPEDFCGKIKIAGNASLAGARACLLDEAHLTLAKELAGHTQEISLGNDADFNEYYMDAMYFE